MWRCISRCPNPPFGSEIWASKNQEQTFFVAEIWHPNGGSRWWFEFFFLIIWNSGKMKTFWWIFFSIGLKLPSAGLFIRFSTGVEGKFPRESLYKGISNFETVRGAEKMLPEAFLWMPGGLASSGDIFHLFLLWLEAPLLRFRGEKHVFFCGFLGLNNIMGI